MSESSEKGVGWVGEVDIDIEGGDCEAKRATRSGVSDSFV